MSTDPESPAQAEPRAEAGQEHPAEKRHRAVQRSARAGAGLRGEDRCVTASDINWSFQKVHLGHWFDCRPRGRVVEVSLVLPDPLLGVGEL